MGTFIETAPWEKLQIDFLQHYQIRLFFAITQSFATRHQDERIELNTLK